MRASPRQTQRTRAYGPATTVRRRRCNSSHRASAAGLRCEHCDSCRLAAKGRWLYSWYKGGWCGIIVGTLLGRRIDKAHTSSLRSWAVCWQQAHVTAHSMSLETWHIAVLRQQHGPRFVDLFKLRPRARSVGVHAQCTHSAYLCVCRNQVSRQGCRYATASRVKVVVVEEEEEEGLRRRRRLERLCVEAGGRDTSMRIETKTRSRLRDVDQRQVF